MQTENVLSRNLMPCLRHRLATLCLLEQSLKEQQAVLAKAYRDLLEARRAQNFYWESEK